MYIYELLSEYFHESIIFTIGNLEDVVYLQRIPTIPRNFSNLETFSFSQSTLQLVLLKEAPLCFRMLLAQRNINGCYDLKTITATCCECW